MAGRDEGVKYINMDISNLYTPEVRILRYLKKVHIDKTLFKQHEGVVLPSNDKVALNQMAIDAAAGKPTPPFIVRTDAEVDMKKVGEVFLDHGKMTIAQFDTAKQELIDAGHLTPNGDNLTLSGRTIVENLQAAAEITRAALLDVNGNYKMT